MKFDYTKIHEPTLQTKTGWFFHKIIPRLYKPLIVIDKENIPDEGAFIVACNHLNALDPVPILYSAYPKRIIHYMAKSELFSNPLAGMILRKGGAFPVQRGIGARPALDYALRVLREGHAVGIFPEGTRYPGCAPRCDDACTGVAKLAYTSASPVLPCAVYSPNRAAFGDTVILRFGKLIENSALKLGTGGSHDRKAATAQIMEEISKIWHRLKQEYGE
ncbi:MAG: 1-acyl-sn-glycerol-3-phosphate acyltransferase [Oscillospiraceae bacterium]|nr:1-acyl-sn-glycerol-3-phosphate acyltransferase [Oscillospiraceae bacterium]